MPMKFGRGQKPVIGGYAKGYQPSMNTQPSGVKILGRPSDASIAQGRARIASAQRRRAGQEIRRSVMTPKRMAGIDAARAASKTSQATKASAKANGFFSRFSNMSSRSKVGIGLGLGVAAAVTMNRRGEGASSGRQSIYRY